MEWQQGIDFTAIPSQGASSLLQAIIIALAAMVCWRARDLVHLAGSLKVLLLGQRPSTNVFTGDYTAGERRTLLLLIVLACLAQGIILARCLGCPTAAMSLKLTVGTTAVYIVQWCATQTLGYTFTDDEQRLQWVRSLALAQGLTGLLLMLPAAVATAYSAATMATIAVAVIALARILFIVKGFRIFYDSVGSLVYFILYLCALEIVPPVALYATALQLTAA